VNIHSGLGLFYSPFGPGIDIHITPESVFTSPRNLYSHAPESADGRLLHGNKDLGGTIIFQLRDDAGLLQIFD